MKSLMLLLSLVMLSSPWVGHGADIRYLKHLPQSPWESLVREQVLASRAKFVSSPHAASVKLLIYKRSGAAPECSGSVVSRNKVLSAAHCFVDDNGRFDWTKIIVIPGLDGWRNERWGRFEVSRVCMQGFNIDTGDNDVAVLTIERDSRGKSIGDRTGWFGTSNHHRGRNVRGYSGLLGEQQREFCPSAKYYANEVRHDCMTLPGMSGSPVYRYDKRSGKRWVVGVNSHRKGRWTVATRLTGEIWDFVKSEVENDQ